MTSTTDTMPVKRLGRPASQQGYTCPRCGRPANHAFHGRVCQHVPLPAAIATEYRANPTVAITDLAGKYRASNHFIADHLLHAGVTRQEIASHRAIAASAKMKESWEGRERGNTPPGSRPCGRCTILIYTSNPPYPYQQNAGGFCPECQREMGIVNKKQQVYNVSYK